MELEKRIALLESSDADSGGVSAPRSVEFSKKRRPAGSRDASSQAYYRVKFKPGGISSMEKKGTSRARANLAGAKEKDAVISRWLNKKKKKAAPAKRNPAARRRAQSSQKKRPVAHTALSRPPEAV